MTVKQRNISSNELLTVYKLTYIIKVNIHYNIHYANRRPDVIRQIIYEDEEQDWT